MTLGPDFYNAAVTPDRGPKASWEELPEEARKHLALYYALIHAKCYEEATQLLVDRRTHIQLLPR